MQRALLPLTFLFLLGLGAAYLQAAGSPWTAMFASAAALRSSSPPLQPGTFPASWNAGMDCDSESEHQVHAYNEDLYIIRQSKCVFHEAPFLYLLFGDEKALLMDTGSFPTADVYGTVKRVIDGWLEQRNMDSIPLIVAHSHSHGDHFLGDAQFIGQPNVEQVVGLSKAEVLAFWNFQNYPVDRPTLDLGNRVIDVLGTPGHHGTSVTLYDRRTQLLLTGDFVYPGHLFVYGSWNKFNLSLKRVANFVAENPVQWIVGCHIEMSATPYEPYAWGTSSHPNEHVLQFPPRELLEIYLAARAMGDQPECVIFDEFVIHPLTACGTGWNG